MYIAAYLFPVFRQEKIERGESIEGYVIYTDGFIKTIYLGGSVLIGVGAGPLWVSQAAYIAECASYKTKARFNSIFLVIFFSAYLATYVIAGSLIKVVDRSTYYIIMTCISIIGSFSFMLIRKPAST